MGLYILGILSVFFELIILVLTFREYFTWQFAGIWIVIDIIYAIAATIIDRMFPAISLVFVNVLPLVLINTYMLSKLLYIRYSLSLLIALLLNAFKRFTGAVFGLLIQVTLQPNQPPIYMRANYNWHEVYQFINVIGAEIFQLPLMIVIGIVLHLLVTKYSFLAFIQHAKIDRYDYLIVLLSLFVYLLAFYYDLQWSLGWQAVTTALFSFGFGVLDVYLVVNKNTQLTDSKLLMQVNEYSDLLKTRNQKLHTFRHDYQNVLLGMSRYLEQDDLAGLKEYFNSVIDDSQNDDQPQLSVEQLNLIQDSAIVGLVYAKYISARKSEVNLKLSISKPVKLPPYNQSKLIRILNDLFTGAIQMAQGTNHEFGFIAEQLSADIVRFTITCQIPKNQRIDLKHVLSHWGQDANQYPNFFQRIKSSAPKHILVNEEIQQNQLNIQIKVR